jgi:hypothetical protein
MLVHKLPYDRGMVYMLYLCSYPLDKHIYTLTYFGTKENEEGKKEIKVKMTFCISFMLIWSLIST